MAPALNYGQQAYEGLKAFRLPGNDSIAVFRADKNAKRMQHSAEFISIPPPPVDLFVDAVKAAVSLNAEFVPPHETGAALYIRPQIFGSSAQLGLSPPEEYLFSVFVIPTGVYHGTHPVKALILDDFDRAAPNGTGSAKVGGNYAPVLRHSDKARREGYDITLHLDSARHEEVDEFSTSGFIGVVRGDDGGDKDDVTVVVPSSKAVIDSVTSDSIQEIARSLGWKVEKRAVSACFHRGSVYSPFCCFLPCPVFGLVFGGHGRCQKVPRSDRGNRSGGWAPWKHRSKGPSRDCVGCDGGHHLQYSTLGSDLGSIPYLPNFDLPYLVALALPEHDCRTEGVFHNIVQSEIFLSCSPVPRISTEYLDRT